MASPGITDNKSIIKQQNSMGKYIPTRRRDGVWQREMRQSEKKKKKKKLKK